MDTTKVDVIVVGSGISGLVCAREIRYYDQSLNVLILEASDRIGGKIATKCDEDSRLSLDLGGQTIIENDHKNVFQLAEMLRIPVYKFCNNLGLKSRIVGSTRKRWRPWAYFELQYFIWKMEKLTAKIDSRHPYKNRKLAAELDSITVKSYIEKNCYFLLAKDLIDSKIRYIFGQEPGSISMLYLLMYANSIGGFIKLLNNPESYGIRGGFIQICNGLAYALGYENISLNQPVNQVITQDSGEILVLTSTQQSFECKKIVFALPTSCLNLIDFQPSLCPKLKFTISNMSPGNLSKFVLVFEKPFWRYHGFSGQVICAHDSETERPFTLLMDTSDESTDYNYALTGFLTTFESLKWANKDEDMLKIFIMDSLCKIFNGNNWPHEAKHFTIKHWVKEPFTGGAICTPRPGTLPFYYSLRRPHGNMFFAGSETATKWIGHISGGIQSGQRAAIQVLDELRPQALSAHEYRILKEIYVSSEEESTMLKKNSFDGLTHSGSVYRWTFVLPMFGLFLGYTALKLRDEYSSVLIPISH